MHATELTDEEFKRFCGLIYRTAGIRIADTKRVLVANRVRRRLRATGIKTFSEYYAFLTSPAGAGEMPQFLDAITTNETYFYRDNQHYQWLGETFLPEIAQQAAQQKRPRVLRIWSAACSTGEEPYSIALKVMAQAAPAFRLENQPGGHRPQRLGAGLGPRRRLRRAGRPPGQPRGAKAILRGGRPGPALDHQGRGPVAGHLEAAQPAHAAAGRAVRLHLPQECADLLRHGVQADRGARTCLPRWPREATW